MFHLDYQRAEIALQSGRLEEVIRLLTNQPLREHRDGQQLLERLVNALLKRGHDHLAANRIAAAQDDALHAKQLAGNRLDVADLAGQVEQRVAMDREERRRLEEQQKAVGQQLQAGELTIGVERAKAIDDPPLADQLTHEVERQRAALSRAIIRMRTAIDQGNPETAIATHAALPEPLQSRTEIMEVVTEAVDQLSQLAHEAFYQGRLDRFAAMETSFLALQKHSPEMRELSERLARCRRIESHFCAGQYLAAEQELSLLDQTTDETAWIETARQALQETIRHLASLQSGPLGLLSTTQPVNAPLPAPPKPLPARSPTPTLDSAGPLLLQVDGLGSLLLFQQPSVRIGGVEQSTACDLSLQTDKAIASLVIRRNGDDYFVHSNAPFQVNGKPTSRKLLVSGDTMEIGRRGRLRFRKPVAASGSAVLELTAAGLARGDIRRVVLMADSLLFGSQGTHFPIESIQPTVVLSSQRGQFELRHLGASRNPNRLDVATSDNPPLPLAIEASAVIAETRFSLRPFPVAAGR